LRLRRELNRAEQRAVRLHVDAGVKAARAAGLSADVVKAVRHHHERFDGTGHPDQLIGEAIPLASRIIAIADAWDAMASRRPHRVAQPVASCAAELDAAAGTQLDGALVALFLHRALFAR
jgi:HD-GYP domain-containing protein (c-di-GMP phosphodiesterase class II)